ncbi:MAG: GNAT family N-acetyltransferase [Sphaerochaetaceae bacterium]|nr:GNAT family N-acetyltransferase [Sphaerochaetaceae bacterium]MDD3366009.1 GNAT family N-acetyltransferase [Sphaerochaetaceae bacterium]
MVIDISTITPALAFILYVFFLIFGFLQYKKDRFYWSFQLYISLFCIWSFGSMMMHVNGAIFTPLLWNRVMLVGLLTAPFALSHFLMDIINLKKRSVRIFILTSYLLTIPLMYLNFSGRIVSAAGFLPDGTFFYTLGPGATFAYSIIYIYLIISLAILFISSKFKDLKGPNKNLILPLVGVLIMLIGIFMNIFPKLGKYPLDIFAATINAMLLFYTIYKYKLINYSRLGINIIYTTIFVIIATVVYSIILLVVQFFYKDFAPQNLILLSIILGLVSALVMYPLRNLLAYIVDTRIIPKRHPYQTTIKTISQRLTTIVDLNNLGEEIVKNLSSGLKIDWVLFAVKELNNEDKFRVLAENNCVPHLNKGDEVVFNFSPELEWRLNELRNDKSDSSIIKVREGEKQLHISDQLPDADVLIPLFVRKEIAAYVLIGYNYLNSRITSIEFDALEILAAQSSLSLENALSFEQLRVQGDELTMSKNKLEAIFNGIASPVCLIDIEYTIMEANTAAVNFYGNKKRELIGKKCYRAFFKRERPCQFCQALDCMHTGIVQETEVNLSEEVYSFQFHNVKVPEKSKNVFIEIINNITEQKNLQEELFRTEKMAGIGTLVAGIAHELNNPLAAIFGTTEIMLSEVEEGSEQQEYLQDILSYSKTASDVIKELSVYSRKEEKKEKQEVDIVKILEFALRLATRVADSKRVDIKRNYHALPVLEANEGELQQLFLNLIVNAIQAMNGEGTLTLSCIEKDDFIYIGVADTGCGIPERSMNQLFTPFFTTKPPGTGTGLGLTNCYNIAEKMGGRIRVRSEENVGSEFTVVFPLSEDSQNAIRFTLVQDQGGMSDVFFIQRKVLVGEKGYLEETIHRAEDEKAMHILAFKGLHPVGTVSLMTSDNFWPLPISKYFDIESVLQSKKSSEIIRLAVLSEMRNTSVSIGLIVLVFLLARSYGVEEVVIDVFADDKKTIKLYKKFGFQEVGTYYSPSAVTVMALQNKTPMEKDKSQLRHFVRPLFSRLRGLFDFGEYTQGVLDEMDRILSSVADEPAVVVEKAVTEQNVLEMVSP